MILLQVSTDSLNNATSVISSGHNFWFYFEVVLIICVIIYQLIHSRKVFLSIEELKGIFNNLIVIKNGVKLVKNVCRGVVMIKNNVMDVDIKLKIKTLLYGHHLLFLEVKRACGLFT